MQVLISRGDIGPMSGIGMIRRQDSTGRRRRRGVRMEIRRAGRRTDATDATRDITRRESGCVSRTREDFRGEPAGRHEEDGRGDCERGGEAGWREGVGSLGCGGSGSFGKENWRGSLILRDGASCRKIRLAPTRINRDAAHGDTGKSACATRRLFGVGEVVDLEFESLVVLAFDLEFGLEFLYE